jgi:hypothetical protein
MVRHEDADPFEQDGRLGERQGQAVENGEDNEDLVLYSSVNGSALCVVGAAEWEFGIGIYARWVLVATYLGYVKIVAQSHIPLVYEESRDVHYGEETAGTAHVGSLVMVSISTEYAVDGKQ